MRNDKIENFKALSDAYQTKTSGSKAHAACYRRVMADSRATAGIRPSTKELVYPIVGERAKGAHIYDLDGNRYVDISMGFGVLLCGHYPDFIKDAMCEQLEQGIQLGPQAQWAGEVASLISELTGVERVSFYNTGTEAVMMALRLARGYRRVKKIVTFENSYHGHYDDVATVYPIFNRDNTLELKYGKLEALEIISARADEIAAVIIEPVQSSNLALKPKQFVRELRALTTKLGIPLIFDEILSGFRIHQGGAQAWLGVEADIAVYGKVVGGGLPIGVVAGKAEFLDQVDGGDWSFGDSSLPLGNRVMSVGTFNKNPLTMATARAMLLHLKEAGPSLQEQLNKRAQEFFSKLNDFFDEHDYPVRIESFGAQFKFVSKKNIDQFIYCLLNEGLYIWENRNLFLSTAHSEEDLAFIQQCVIASANKTFRSDVKMPPALETE
ncbi:MAG: aminotransferase class III-fold pyridoxal phosphate-dependent enzyme [Candidatus Sedimenticola sp. (ex Thyasira tokunagai)]